METIIIDRDIASYAISASMVRDLLSKLPSGTAVSIVVNSGGGSVYEGVALFNVIKDYAKTLDISVTIQGLAASMASYVALAAKMGNKSSVIRAESNAIFMIHNPWAFSIGDYKSMQKDAALLERLAALMATAYVAGSTMDNSAVRAAMDAETFYIGQEIMDAGFVDEIIPIAETDDSPLHADRESLLTSAKIAVDQVVARMETKEQRGIMEKAVALLASTNTQAQADIENTPAPAGTMEEHMNPEELLAKHPECYKAVVARGVEQERKRADAHLKMAEGAKSYETAAKYIRDGSSLSDDSVIADYQVKAMANNAAQARNTALDQRDADNIRGFGTGADAGGKEAILAALDAEIKVNK